MNPGASWMSSVVTVRSRIAASPDTSSAMWTAGWVKRWAMKWEARLCSAASASVAVLESGWWLPRCTDVIAAPPLVHASPAARLLFYTPLEPAKPVLILCSSSMCLMTFFPALVNESSSKATGAAEGKMFSITARAGGETGLFTFRSGLRYDLRFTLYKGESESDYSYLFSHHWEGVASAGRGPECAVGLKNLRALCCCFLQLAYLHMNGCSLKPDLQTSPSFEGLSTA